MNLRNILDWLAVRDYEQAKADSTRRIMGRFARGNVLVQSGHYIGDADADAVIARGDRAMEQLERAAAHH